MIRRLIGWICTILVVIGCLMILYPNIDYWLSSYQYQQVFEQIDDGQDAVTLDAMQSDALYQDMQAYNQEIYANGQEDLKDAWSYEQSNFELTNDGTVDAAVGYVSIESISVKLPLYLGASQENLSKGATVLGQTSMPIGGENTNCVIAAHRRTKKHPMLSDIEEVQLGDKVLIHNLWETLEYQVVSIQVISPDDIDAIRIQDGKDLVTIITCHPYPYNYQRYVLYCQRVDENLILDDTKTVTEEIVVLSQQEIEWEKTINLVGLCVVFVLITIIIVRTIYKISKKRK